ncbi:hypothetical protein OTU49_006428 [Cherax quadricarinatus]
MLVKNASKVKRNYVETLLGNLDKHKDRYVTRSSLRNHETLEVPTIFFHGTDDEVVPPSQAREMYEMVRNKSIPTALLLFQGEGHGFTRPDTCMKALEAEYCFFAQVFNLTPADLTCDVMIDNLDTWRAES